MLSFWNPKGCQSGALICSITKYDFLVQILIIQWFVKVSTRTYNRYSALLLTPLMYVPYKCGTIQKGNKQGFQQYNIYFQEALLQTNYNE